MEYRDVHGSSRLVEKYFDVVDKSSMSETQKKDVHEFVKQLRLGKIGAKVKDRRIGIYLQFLMRIHEYFGKDIASMTEKEAEKFYEDLHDGNKIKKKNGMPYSENSKDEFVKTLKRYLGWKWGKESTKYVKRLRWMKATEPKSDKKAITKEQVEKVLEQDETARNKCLFMFLFDSGARIEEALNVTFADLKAVEGKNTYYTVHLRGQKTEESDRTISLPLCTTYLKEWIQKHPDVDEESFLFPVQYDNARKIIKQMSKKVLKIELKPHELRHSSATHYIQFGGFGAENIGGFYYRYGWRFGSKEALTYIKQYLYGGEVGQEKVVQHIISDRIEELEKRLAALEEAQLISQSAIVMQNEIFKELKKKKEVTISRKDLKDLVDMADKKITKDFSKKK